MRTTRILILSCTAAFAQESVDLGVIDRIKTEAFDHSRVMDHLYNLSDVYGPRLTGSREFEQAANWASSRLKAFGLSDVHFEKWTFGRSWSLEQSSLELIEPQYSQLNAVPLAWSAPTEGEVTGELVKAPVDLSYRGAIQFAEYEKRWSGKLRGKIVLLSEVRVPRHQTNPQFRRMTAGELSEVAFAPPPIAIPEVKRLQDIVWPEDPDDIQKLYENLPPSLMMQAIDAFFHWSAARGEFFAKEGVVGVLIADDRAHEGILAGGYHASGTLAPPTFVVAAEQYNRVVRLLDHKSPVRVRISVKAAVSSADVDGINIVGEIPGGAKKDEVIMIGAHFDSWNSATGATDNGAGSAVMMEVMRILKTLNLKLDRTVRIGLWSGEEQGALGSRAYVKVHFGDPDTMAVTVEHAKLSGYFNLDNGSGKIRGVYLQRNEAMRPLFESWLGPFRDLGVATVSIRNTGGTDHLSFDAIGLPGFQFIQDPLDSDTTHHSNMDTYDHAIPEDLMQASAVISAVVYQAANRDKMLPRREMRKP